MFKHFKLLFHISETSISKLTLTTHQVNTVFLSTSVVRLTLLPKRKPRVLIVGLPDEAALLRQVCQTNPVKDVSLEEARK